MNIVDGCESLLSCEFITDLFSEVECQDFQNKSRLIVNYNVVQW